MGKALLIIILGTGTILAKLAFSAEQTGNRTAAEQADHEEYVLAREIARSGFNTGMAIVRSHGSDVDAGVREVMGSNFEGMTGDERGGTYEVKAYTDSGHSVKVRSVGRYGDAVAVLHDTYRVPVLTARELSSISIDAPFVPQAGYCSAIFMEMFVPDGNGVYTHIPPKMIFVAENRRNNRLRLPIKEVIQPGTQMNFLMAVDQNCSERLPDNRNNTCEVRKHLYNDEYPVDYNGWNYVRPALAVAADNMHAITENVWGFVEQHPTENQTWRISWEDLNNSWDNPDSMNPRNSLQATKLLGYQGQGWPTRDSYGFRTLLDYGNQPDFSDQVIRITLNPINDTQARQIEDNKIQELLDCDVIDEDPRDHDNGSGNDGNTDPGTGNNGNGNDDGSGDEGGSTTGGDGDGSGDGSDTGGTGDDEAEEDDDEPAFDCNCRRNKWGVMHRPPGNPANERVICIGTGGKNAHLRKHDDYVVCRGSTYIGD